MVGSVSQALARGFPGAIGLGIGFYEAKLCVLLPLFMIPVCLSEEWWLETIGQKGSGSMRSYWQNRWMWCAAAASRGSSIKNPQTKTEWKSLAVSWCQGYLPLSDPQLCFCCVVQLMSSSPVQRSVCGNYLCLAAGPGAVWEPVLSNTW